jgi:hypothetical protein
MRVSTAKRINFESMHITINIGISLIILFMKNFFYLLLTLLFTACFRGPGLTHSPAATSPDVSVAPPDQRSGNNENDQAAAGLYAASEGAAAAGTGAPGASPVISLEALAPAGDLPGTLQQAGKPLSPGKNLRRKIRETLRTVPAEKLSVYTEDDPVVPKRSGMALASLVLGIIGLSALLIGAAASSGGLTLLSLIAGILALVFGAVAKGQIRNGQGNKADRGRATAGFILGLVNVGIFALIFLLAIAVIAAWGGR